MHYPSSFFLVSLPSMEFSVLFILGIVISLPGISKAGASPISREDIAGKLRNDTEAIKLASTDYGHIVKQNPAAVFYPSGVNDIAGIVKFVYQINSSPFDVVAARGQGHSVRGQASAKNGVVVNMTSLGDYRNGTGIVIGGNAQSGYYADVGGEQRWIDVLRETVTRRRLAPVSWTDYLYLSVGGTLSNAGISGQTFRFGPQISNVYELDVVTGKGDVVTCSPTKNSELFFGVLGGLGQFGIITRARIPLNQAPTRVKWVRMLYTDFSDFSDDQVQLIKNNGKEKENALDYVEGQLLLQLITPDNSSFYPLPDQTRIVSLITKHGIVYCLEVAKYYDDQTAKSVDRALNYLLKGLKYESGFIFEKDVSYIDFLDRVHKDELTLQALGLWDVPHPWLNLFLPKSRILDFNEGVFKGILLKRNLTSGIIVVYPMFKNKWDSRTSAVTTEEEIFYAVGFLFSSGFNDWKAFDNQNKDILQFCENAGIKVKQYLPHYEAQQDWINHFGSKWEAFKLKKSQFDPKNILSPGQKIFSRNCNS